MSFADLMGKHRGAKRRRRKKKPSGDAVDFASLTVEDRIRYVRSDVIKSVANATATPNPNPTPNPTSASSTSSTSSASSSFSSSERCLLAHGTRLLRKTSESLRKMFVASGGSQLEDCLRYLRVSFVAHLLPPFAAGKLFNYGGGG